MATNKQNIQTLDFDPSTQQYAEWTAVMPSNYGGGTFTAKFHWLANDTTTNAAVWGIAARAYGDGDAVDQAFGTAQEVTDANASTANQVRVSAATSAVTIAGTPAAGKLVQFRVYRKAADAADTLTVNAKLLAVELTY